MTFPIDTQAALKHFIVVDPTMAALVSTALTAPAPIALPEAKSQSDYFGSIVRSIVSQQISVKAADAVFVRVLARVSGVEVVRTQRRDTPGITPERVLAVPEDELRACGLSLQKTKYIRHNALVWDSIDTKHFATRPDNEIIEELVKLYGIGRWTAEMFLMFTLARPDVFSFGDLGLMQSIYEHYPVKPHHVRKINTLVESWAPHRTLASLALWWHKDGGPVLL
ncbi:DNA-3-methyladenine glycosylase 2 family protein [Patescibacteria group bacterium]|nr:DNA-3-methyladenine glycosylase 2 family protein [Patescibacteria group bacterium]